MNTAVSYKTPRHTNKYGRYKSYTQINGEYVGYIKITLTWFNASGWYWSLDCMMTKWNGNKPECIMEACSSPMNLWRKGIEVSLCAKDAESAAHSLLNKYMVEVSFAPYVL